MIKKFKLKDCIVILSVLLFISIVINIYNYVNIYKYKYRIGKVSQLNIDDIKQRNESNMDILNISIEQGCIKNEELLKLYKNYDIISRDVIRLWEQYGEYKKNNLDMFSKKIDTQKIIENDIHSKIKEHMSITLNEAMKNNEAGLVLKSDYLTDFTIMKQVSEKIYNYFEDFNSKDLLNLTGEDREKKIIKNKYWIDMLEGIYNISDDYANIQWNVDNSENVNNIDLINDENDIYTLKK